ncbi:UNVERIFIED_CONTAM: hypothetical protein HDU68_007466 [Siphonaria sp. JEL0065]|nr:hypothetical protein HDU68_007466 [Siphonaria sp. JEL0065]
MTLILLFANLLASTLALPHPQTPQEQQIQQIQQMQASSTDQTGNTQAALQNQINSLVGNTQQQANWNQATTNQNAYLSQIQALQQQMGATTDPNAQIAIQNQIIAVQNQMNQAAQVAPNAWSNSPYWSASTNINNGWGQGSQNAFLAQIQAMQQQLAATTDPSAQAAIQNQIAAVQTQMNNHATAAAAWNPYWNNGWNSNYWNNWNNNGWNEYNSQNQNRNAALTAQIQSLQQQMGATTDVNAQAAINQQIAAVQAQMV